MKANEIPGLTSLFETDNGGWQGWVWATEIEHPDFNPILAMFGENRIKLEDSDLTVHMPISEVQMNLHVDDNGKQQIDVVAIVEGFVGGEGLEQETDDNPIEKAIFEFFEKIL